MEENTTLNIMLDLIPIYEYCRKHGLLSVVMHETFGLHMMEQDFRRFFPEHEIEFYTDSRGEPARRGYAYYKGQRFFALLDYEPYKEEDDEVVSAVEV